MTQNCVSRDRSRRRRVLSALGSLSRGCRVRKKDPITAWNNYGVERISWQRFSRGFLGSIKSSVNVCAMGITEYRSPPSSHQQHSFQTSIALVVTSSRAVGCAFIASICSRCCFYNTSLQDLERLLYGTHSHVNVHTLIKPNLMSRSPALALLRQTAFELAGGCL